ncbi:MAG: tRNA 2-thiouridine(34) synthase MnmA [Planctomycetes bacterium]|nr:tRNA 2-thiouridine(34) synthase MnmA [Planctomycetota bacterium]
MTSNRVLVALSGGVDSSVAAYLLQQQGYEVIGVFLRNGIEKPPTTTSSKQGCCSVEDSRDAASVADHLGIPFYAIDMQQEFQSIIDYFADEYLHARTPNPCMRCNRDIKFGKLWELAAAVGAEYLATGHYARIVRDGDDYQLHRGQDISKDQSYVVFPLGPETLAKTLLPIGDLDKVQTREIAKQAGLLIHDKAESFEICFVPDNDYRGLLTERNQLGKPGRIVDLNGNQLALHNGHAGFTRGQRRGLGFASTQPMYVIDIDPASGDVLVGDRAATVCNSLTAVDFHCFGTELKIGDSWTDITVQYRSAFQEHRANLICIGEGLVEINFIDHVESINPGQGVAVYRQQRLLGGGFIEDVRSAHFLNV